jgi:hypothetical protein
MLQTVIGIRITVKGDSESKQLVANLRTTPVYFLTGEYGILHRIPDGVLRVTAGGPGIGSHTPPFVAAKLVGDYLIVDFDVPLIVGEEFYTFEFYLGYNPDTLPTVASMIDAVEQDKPEGIISSPPDAPHGFSA